MDSGYSLSRRPRSCPSQSSSGGPRPKGTVSCPGSQKNVEISSYSLLRNNLHELFKMTSFVARLYLIGIYFNFKMVIMFALTGMVEVYSLHYVAN